MNTIFFKTYIYTKTLNKCLSNEEIATVISSQDYTEPEPVEGGEEVKVLKIMKNDIVQDYTKILQILGD